MVTYQEKSVSRPQTLHVATLVQRTVNAVGERVKPDVKIKDYFEQRNGSEQILEALRLPPRPYITGGSPGTAHQKRRNPRAAIVIRARSGTRRLTSRGRISKSMRSGKANRISLRSSGKKTAIKRSRLLRPRKMTTPLKGTPSKRPNQQGPTPKKISSDKRFLNRTPIEGGMLKIRQEVEVKLTKASSEIEQIRLKAKSLEQTANTIPNQIVVKLPEAVAHKITTTSERAKIAPTPNIFSELALPQVSNSIKVEAMTSFIEAQGNDTNNVSENVSVEQVPFDFESISTSPNLRRIASTYPQKGNLSDKTLATRGRQLARILHE